MRVARCVLLAAALAACRAGEVPSAPATPAPVGLPAREPVVRVGIVVDSAAVRVTASTPFDVSAGDRTLASLTANVVVTFRAATGDALDAARENGESLPTSTGPVRVVARDGGAVMIGDRTYRGAALIMPRQGGRVTAVNVVDLERYLLGVVPREIGARPADEIEAVKAQAVAARTYAIGNLGGRDELGFDFYATVRDQVYGGAADEDSIATRAVTETRGEIITHAGRPILAYYSSTCGGRTAAIEQSWPWRTPLPYLQSVSDRVPGTDEAYCSTSNRYRWTTSWTRDQLIAVLGETLRQYTGSPTAPAEPVRDIAIVDTNDAGRVTLSIAAGGQDYVVRADSVRRVLRPPSGGILNSSRISEVALETADERVTGLEISGGGWGHGIGMCQVGAMGRARAGQTYREILTTYYTDTEIRRLY